MEKKIVQFFVSVLQKHQKFGSSRSERRISIEEDFLREERKRLDEMKRQVSARQEKLETLQQRLKKSWRSLRETGLVDFGEKRATARDFM